MADLTKETNETEAEKLISDGSGTEDGARPSEQNILDADDSPSKEKTPSGVDDDVVIVPDEIEDKPLTIDMTPNAQTSGKDNNNGQDDEQLELTQGSKNETEAPTDKNKGQEKEKEEAGSLLNVDLHEGKPTTVRGEKAKLKEEKKKRQQLEKQKKRDSKNDDNDEVTTITTTPVAPTDEENALLAKTENVEIDVKDEEENDTHDDEEGGNIVVVHDSRMHQMQQYVEGLYESGALLSIVVSITLWAVFIWMVVKHNVAAIICFVIVYVIYIIECFLSKAYLEILKADVSDTVSVKVLDALKESAPVIHWNIECYRIETTYSVTNPDKKIILWYHGKDEDHYVLKKAGYSVQSFHSEWTIANYMSDPMNYPKIAAIILPVGEVVGYSDLQKSITKYVKQAREKSANVTTGAANQNGNIADNGRERQRSSSSSSNSSNGSININNNTNKNNNDIELPIFLKWHSKKRDRMEKLLKDCVMKDVLTKSRQERVSHTSDEIYKFKDWIDISEDLPQLTNTLTNLTIEKSFVLKDKETRHDYNNQKSIFRDSEENNCDEQQRFQERLKIRGWKHGMLIKLGNHDNSDVPWWMSKIGFWITSILMLTIISRLKVYGVKDVTWRLIKQVSI